MAKEGIAYEQYTEHLLSAAADGDIQGIEAALKAIPDIDVRNGKGWTALMFAARNGHLEAVKKLVSKGCDVTMMNAIGQTAHDIAEFWQHRNVAQFLSSTNSSKDNTSVQPTISNKVYFSDSPLNRVSQRRTDTSWLSKLGSSSNAIYIFMSDLRPYEHYHDKTKSNTLLRIRYSDELKEIRDSGVTSVFLGVESSSDGMDYADQLDENSCVGWFVVDTTGVPQDKLKRFVSDAIQIVIPMGFLQMSRSEAAIVAQARSMLAWHERYKFCPTCGKGTVVKDAGYKRECVDKECLSNKGVHNTCYPRTDPSVIMAVLSADRTKVLLGRDKRFPGSMYSCLAGFMEPGECIEEACRREVFEESGIRVSEVKYHCSQPWPMPSSLMIGCIAYAESSNIKIDKEELEDARWFTWQDIRQMLSGQHPQHLFCPPEQTIAHQLLKHCVTNLSKL